MPIGTPASGPTARPAMMSASMRLAVWRASSGVGVAKSMKRRFKLIHASEHGVDDFDWRELFGANVLRQCDCVHPADLVGGSCRRCMRLRQAARGKHVSGNHAGSGASSALQEFPAGQIV